MRQWLCLIHMKGSRLRTRWEYVSFDFVFPVSPLSSLVWGTQSAEARSGKRRCTYSCTKVRNEGGRIQGSRFMQHRLAIPNLGLVPISSQHVTACPQRSCHHRSISFTGNKVSTPVNTAPCLLHISHVDTHPGVKLRLRWEREPMRWNLLRDGRWAGGGERDAGRVEKRLRIHSLTVST